jgi:ribosome biogenesis GTPase
VNALVYRSTGSWYIVKTESGDSYNARIKGILKIDGITSTNPVAVGDEVKIELEDEVDNVATIIEILQRKNYIARSSPHHKMQHHIVAANLDCLLVFATLKDPKTSLGFIDRFLVSAEAFHIPAIIVFNKSDIYREKEMQQFEKLQEIYTSIGYKVLLVSLEKKEGIDELKNILKDKTTLLSGHSGTGKSTFINLLFPEFDLRTQEVSGWSGKGMHTTTFAEMFNLPFGGKIIDTPGIRELGIVDIPKQELSHYFPEMKVLISHCKYNNCLHINEPGCAVKEAVENGKISSERYSSYYNILQSMEEKNY